MEDTIRQGCKQYILETYSEAQQRNYLILKDHYTEEQHKHLALFILIARTVCQDLIAAGATEWKPTEILEDIRRNKP